MSCPTCGRQPNRFVNGFLACEGGHEWQGIVEQPRPIEASVPIVLRGREFNLTPNANAEFRTLLCLVALNNPDVDAVLNAFGVVLDVGGQRVFPMEGIENANE